MRKRKLTFQEMIQKNKEELLKDEIALEKIEAKIIAKHEKFAESK